MSHRVPCVSALHLLLLSLSPPIAAFAALSQGREGPAVPSDVQQQIAALASKDAGEVLGAVAKLGEMGPRAAAAIPTLVQLLHPRGLETVSVGDEMIGGFNLTASAAAHALAQIGKAAIPALRAALAPSSADSFSYGNTAYYAGVGLAQMKDKSATSVLLTALANPAFPRRGDVAKALAHSEDAQAAAALLGSLHDKDPNLRAAVIEGLSTKKTPDITDAILPSLRDESTEVRSATASALKEHADPRTIDALVHALGDSETFVRNLCAQALGAIRDPRAVPPLVDLVAKDPDNNVRFQAGRALGAITGEDFGEDGARWQKWWRERKSRP